MERRNRYIATTIFLTALMTAPLSLPVSAGSADVTRENPRVVNGLTTQERPTTAALLVRSGINYGQICSATLIGCRTVLTAAHCVCYGGSASNCGTPKPSSYAVYLQNVGIVHVSSIKVDPSYAFGRGGDVAVLRLASPVVGVAPTPINTTMRPAHGTAAEIAGYGITRGGLRDNGILRRGMARTASCVASGNPDTHVCWNFTAPVGAAGEDSNTCNGDSGGPLFADLGEGETVIGVTSGGLNYGCLPYDNSFDTDVYVHRAFIEEAAGADLGARTCGNVAQVGEAGTRVDAFSFHMPSKQDMKCRKEIAKQASLYTTSALETLGRCMNGVAGGEFPGPCPGDSGMEALVGGTAKVCAERIARKCPSDTLTAIRATSSCSHAATPAALAECVLSAGDVAVSTALNTQYADSAMYSSIDNPAERSCQQKVGQAGAALVKASLKATTNCLRQLDLGRAASCPDAKASKVIAKAEAKAARTILAACTDEAVSGLDASGRFGGSCAGVLTAADLAACQAVEHAALVGRLAAAIGNGAMATEFTFTVPEGAARLHLALNGIAAGVNDHDIYLSFEESPTVEVHDFKSENGGMFESIEVLEPSAGTWHARLARYAGADRVPYQLTATSFGN